MDRTASSYRIDNRILLDLIAEMDSNQQNMLTFARFMELALYHPEWGYYASGNVNFGKAGDYFTNVQTGSIFGQVIAKYIYQQWKEVGEPRIWTLVELGPGDGVLFQQIYNDLLKSDIHMPRAFLVDKSIALQQRQQKLLADYPVNWATTITEIPQSSFSFLYSNELLDSFPVHSLQMSTKGNYEEVYIKRSVGDILSEELADVSTTELSAYIKEFSFEVPLGGRFEVNLQARKWLKEIATWIKKGILLTVDYGGTTADLLARRDGTIRCFHKHTMQVNPYAYPGKTDITAHVNFEMLIKDGKAYGLHDYSYQTQSQFLLEAGILDLYPTAVSTNPLGQEAKLKRMINQLIHPDALGEAFQVLVQKRL